jgi:hypothetical protein
METAGTSGRDSFVRRRIVTATKGMKIAGNMRPLCPSLVTAAEVSAALPFVIPRRRLACGKLREE